MEQIELQAANREILGKKVRFLRRQKITPVHLFGHSIESLALQCDTAHLQQVLAQSGKTKLISLRLDKSKKPRSVMAREIQRNSITGELLHVDLYQVRMTEKIKLQVPIVLVGEAPALKLKENMLLQELNSLNVECLPDKIPASIELDLSSLIETGQALHVKDIVLDEEVTVLNGPEQMVAKIAAKHIEVVEEEAIEAPEAAPLLEEESKEE